MELIKAGLPEEQIKELEERMRKDKEFKESEAKYEALLERIERLDIDLKNKQNAVNQKSDERIERLDIDLKNQLDSTVGFITLFTNQYFFEYGVKEGIKFIIECLLNT